MESLPKVFMPTLLALLVTSSVFMFWEEISISERKTWFPEFLDESNPLCAPSDYEGNSSRAVACSFQRHASDLTLFLGENEVIKIRDSIKYHKNLPSLCDNDVELLIMIVSSVGAYDNRNASRETWKNAEKFKKEMSNVKVVYLIPTKSDADEKRSHEETEQNGDIVQIRFYENARTLILLEAIALNWFKKYCFNAKYYLKTNDRFMLNPRAIKNVLSEIDSRADLTSSMYGRIADRAPVARSGDRSTCEFFYPFDTYPEYMRDNTYLMYRETVLKLDAALDHSRFFPLADVYMSGLTAALANIKPVETDRIVTNYNDGLWAEAKSLGYIAANSNHMKDHWKDFMAKNIT